MPQIGLAIMYAVMLAIPTAVAVVILVSWWRGKR